MIIIFVQEIIMTSLACHDDRQLWTKDTLHFGRIKQHVATNNSLNSVHATNYSYVKYAIFDEYNRQPKRFLSMH